MSSNGMPITVPMRAAAAIDAENGVERLAIGSVNRCCCIHPDGTVEATYGGTNILLLQKLALRLCRC